ncbi:MAG: TlpA disulfide reductase family protein [Spirochaetales bacterium]|jgi:thiol-disulfide isomerase/thioredoxin|nr:TlpA disulfide reductase family protein [Spirochaetales bacterium]
MSKKVVLIALVMTAVLAAASCSQRSKEADAAQSVSADQSIQNSQTQPQSSGSFGSLILKPGYELASFTGTTLEGKDIGPRQLQKAKISLINVWTTTCPYCIEEMPDLEEVSHIAAGRDVQVIGIIGDGKYKPKDAQSLIERTGVTYLNIVPSGPFEKTIMSIAYAVPTTVLVDKNGRMIGEPIMGKRDKDFFLQLIDSALTQL